MVWKSRIYRTLVYPPQKRIILLGASYIFRPTMGKWQCCSGCHSSSVT